MTNKTYLQQLCMDTGCSLEDLLEAIMNDEWVSGKSVEAAWHDDSNIYETIQNIYI